MSTLHVVTDAEARNKTTERTEELVWHDVGFTALVGWVNVFRSRDDVPARHRHRLTPYANAHGYWAEHCPGVLIQQAGMLNQQGEPPWSEDPCQARRVCFATTDGPELSPADWLTHYERSMSLRDFNKWMRQADMQCDTDTPRQMRSPGR